MDYAGRHGVKKVFLTAEELIEDENIDAVYIATPPSSHKEYALMCAKAKKVCYIEKPLAMTYTESLEIMEAFEQAGVKAFVAYYRRCLPRFLKVKELIEGKAVGDIRFVSIENYRPPAEDELEGGWRVNPQISGGGIFMDIASHHINILEFMLGEMIDIHGVGANQAGLYKPEDIVNTCFKFKNGITGVGTWCFTAWKPVDQIKIIGNRGQISFECFGTGPILLETEEGITEIIVETPEHVQQNLIQTIVDELNQQGNCPSDVKSAVRTGRLLQTVYDMVKPD